MLPVCFATPRRGHDPRTLDWMFRCDKIERADYLYHLDNLMGRGRDNAAWLEEDGELLVLGATTLQANLEGLKDFINYANVTVNGTILCDRLFGIYRGDISANSYVDFNEAAADWPGVTLNGHSIAVFVTTNNVGPYQALGATGQGGNKSFMIREGSGFRSGAWLASDQAIFGDGQAWGFSLASRTGANAVTLWRNGIKETNSSAAVTLPAGDISALAAEPGSSNTPNKLLVAWIGGPLTDEQCAQMASDVLRFVRDLGIYDAVEVPPVVLGENCFGPTAIDGIVPADLRVYRQLAFPLTDSTPAEDTNAYPITDSIDRAYVISQDVQLLDADPITATDTSDVLDIDFGASHGVVVGDVLEIAGSEGGGGFAAGDINKRHHVTGVDGDIVEITMDAAATSTETFGGIAEAISVRKIMPNVRTSTFTPTRGGRYWHTTWMNRGLRDVVDGAITGATKGNDSYGPITRLTQQGTGPEDPTYIAAGVSCRPHFSTKAKARTAFLVHAAHVAGYLDRNDPDDPLGEGYLDIAEAGVSGFADSDLDPAKVLTWQEALVQADDIFTTPYSFATSIDYVILSAKQLDDVQNLTMSQKGIWIDDEASDDAGGLLRFTTLTRLNQICAAKGIKWGSYGHFMAGSQAEANGWTKEYAADIIAMSECEAINIIASENTPAGNPAAYLDTQVDMFTGTSGLIPIPYEKIQVSLTLGPGKNSIDDPYPFSSSQVTFEHCEEVAAWIQARGVKHTHVRRVGMPEGGTIDRVPNQQLIRYLPDLTDE
jgi:hypothetical protein